MPDVKKDFIQITGREALSRLLEGEEVYGVRGAEVFKIIDDILCVRDYSYEDQFEGSSLELNTFLNPVDSDWYIAPPFDVRKEMLNQPNEWVAKYYAEDNHKYHYLGFDSNEMCAVFNRSLEPKVTVWSINADIAEGEMLDKAIPLDKDDLKAIEDMVVELYLNKNK